MRPLLFTLLFAALAATLVILAAGLFVMARGGELNRRWSNRLMRWRVIAQAITIGLFLLVLASGRS